VRNPRHVMSGPYDEARHDASVRYRWRNAPRRLLREIMTSWLARQLTWAIRLMIPRTCVASSQAGGPVGRPLDVGMGRGVPPSRTGTLKDAQLADKIKVSLTQLFMLNHAGWEFSAPLSVTRLTVADH